MMMMTAASGKGPPPPPALLKKVPALLSLLFLLAVVLAFFSSGPGAQAADNPCETVAANPNSGTEYIRCIGLVKSYLLVMTNTWKIWQIAESEIDQDVNKPINTIYFGSTKPVPIEEKWPEITHKAITKKEAGYTNDSGWFNWEDLREHSVQCAPGLDDDGEYLFIFAPYEGTSWGTRFDINNKVNLIGFQSRHPDTETKWMSAREPAKMYIWRQSQGFLEMLLYSACDDDEVHFGRVHHSYWWKNFNESIPPHMGYVDDKVKTECLLIKYPPYHTMCLDGADKVYLGEPNDTCHKFTTKIFNGFVDNGHFYLFTNSNVISFPESVYNRSETATIRTVPYSGFINCSANPNPRVFGGKHHALVIGLLVALALILLICCLCILLCLVREAIARRKRKKGKKGSKSGKGKKGFFGGGTARSGGLLSPGALSKKFSSVSKRSTGGLTPGKKLTTAGGGGSIRTKRSKGPSKSGSKAISGKGASRTRRSKGPGSGGSSKRKLTTAGGRGPSHAVTGRSKMTRSSKKSRKTSRGAHGGSNKATERSKLKNK